MNYAVSLQAHYASRWGPAEKVLRLLEGPSHDLPDDFAVLRFRRGDSTVCYATRCMSLPGEAELIELHILCAERDAELAQASVLEILTALAHYHRTGARLAPGHTVNLGRPWLEGSACSYGLVSLPYLDGPTLENEPNFGSRCLWLLPITAEEKDFKVREGVEALESRFESNDFGYTNPFRPSVC